ncbi:MAG: HAD family hydrolase [Thermoplasmatales archaeon]|nr:HAD family hydrolase [Thermoplasmatales archaeon]
MTPALFIDRDGTINANEPEYPHKPEHLRIYEDAVELMKEYQNKGYLIIIITNQSGIGRGYFTLEQMQEFNNLLISELAKRGVKINALYFCPHTPADNCNCRKPKLGLIEQAMKDFEIDLKNSIIVGDRDDIEGEMARKLGIKFIKVVR